MNDEPTFDPRRRQAIRDLVVSTARATSSRPGRGRRAAVIATLVVLAVGVSGGVAYALGTGVLHPAPVISVAPTPIETATPVPANPMPTVTTAPTPPTPAPDPTDTTAWIIGFDGVGPVKLGPSFEQQLRELPAFSDITDPLCVGGYLDLQAPNGFSLLFVSGQDEPAVTAAITFSDALTTPAADRPASPRTAAGIGINSTKEELLAVYPGIEQTGRYQSDDYPYYGLTDGNGGWIVFGIVDDKVGSIQIANEASLPIENRSVRTLPSERCPA